MMEKENCGGALAWTRCRSQESVSRRGGAESEFKSRATDVQGNYEGEETRWERRIGETGGGERVVTEMAPEHNWLAVDEQIRRWRVNSASCWPMGKDNDDLFRGRVVPTKNQCVILSVCLSVFLSFFIDAGDKAAERGTGAWRVCRNRRTYSECTLRYQVDIDGTC